MPTVTRWIAPLLVTAALVGGAWALVSAREAAPRTAAARGAGASVAVLVAPVERGAITQRRLFTGTLVAKREVVVSAKVSGRVERVAVELGDVVRRGQVVAELDDEELAQAKAQAQAAAAVAAARKLAADNALEIAARDLERMTGLRRRGVIAEEEFDRTRAAKLEAEAAVAVARSEVARAKAALAAASVREGYTRVSVDWRDGEGEERVVAARHVDEGALVGAGAPLITVVGLDPLVAAVHVTERDYGLLREGMAVALRTDAYPEEEFAGTIARLAPVFAEASRQARVELEVANPDGRLRPGMFARVEITLARLEDVTLAPRSAIVEREEGAAVFVISDEGGDGPRARLQPVTVGATEGERAQIITGVEPPARVVTLGQSLLEDGALVSLSRAPGAGDEEAR